MHYAMLTKVERRSEKLLKFPFPAEKVGRIAHRMRRIKCIGEEATVDPVAPRKADPRRPQPNDPAVGRPVRPWQSEAQTLLTARPSIAAAAFLHQAIGLPMPPALSIAISSSYPYQVRYRFI